MKTPLQHGLCVVVIADNTPHGFERVHELRTTRPPTEPQATMRRPSRATLSRLVGGSVVHQDNAAAWLTRYRPRPYWLARMAQMMRIFALSLRGQFGIGGFQVHLSAAMVVSGDAVSLAIGC